MSVASSDGQYRRKETFVEDMLYHIADSLASDAEFGYNNANQIRDRVEDIAVDMNSNISSSRAVLESRFALGKDNCQYLAQAVAVLWAGDGGERLRVLPPGQMPSILRQASADGVVRAMRGVMSEQIENSRRAVVDAIALVAWMMQSETIRVAVLEYVKLSNLKEEAEKIQVEYDKGENNGMDYLIKIAKSAYEQETKEGAGDHATVQSLLQAVYALTDPSSASQMILGDMLNESQNLVNRTARDSHLVAELQSVIGQMSALTALSQPESNFAEAAEDEGSTNHCERKFDAWGRVTKRMGNGTAVTRNQFTVATHAAFSSMRGNSIGDEKINDRWNVSRVISPFWNQGSLSEPTVKQKAWDQIIGDKPNSRDSTLSEEMRRAIRNVYTLGIKSLGGNLLEQRQFLQNNIRDTLYIDYCMIRGNCGFKGPHQTSTNQDDALPYQYPQNPMIGYTEGKYCDAKMDVLANDMHLQIREMMHKHYVEPEERHKVRYDTDPYPRVLNEIGSSDGNGSESARKVAWAPVPGQNDEISFDPESSNLCEASMYEFMLRALELQAAKVEKDDEDLFKQRRVRCLRAVAASIKIRQLMPMANLKQYNDMNDTTAQKDNQVYVTRPAKHCVPAGSMARPYEMQRVSMPYDSGIALFENGTPGTKPVSGTLAEDDAEIVKVLGSDYTSDRKEEFQQDGSVPIAPFPNPNGYPTYDVDKSAKDVTRWLRQGVESGWKNEDGENTPTVGVAPANFTLFAQPVRSPRETGYDDNLYPNARFSTDFDKEMVPDDLYDGNIHNAVVRGMNAIGLLRQIDKEHKYIQKLSIEDSAERVGVFGVHGEKTLEGATKERRDGVWNDALREINVSGDRLYRFITNLTGAIGESADSAISWEDEDLKQMSKDALARQKTLSERVSRFQTKLVESVVSSTLKSSKLQLDMRKSNTNSQELVVLSADTRENIRQIADGEAGHGFFEAQVEFNDALGKYAKPMSIKDIVSDLQSVSRAFYDQIAASLAPSSGASYARIVEPRNSFMLHLKPDTMAAIQKAYDHISSEMKHCGGYHREIHLWEFVEGKDWTLVTRFAELVGLMLQNTRMRSGSFAAYVGMSQQVANGNNIRMQLQRLRAQACIYLVAQPNAPMWLHKNGRTWYFGGSTSGPNSNGGMRADRAKKRRCRNESQSYDDYGACIGRQKRRLNHPSRDQNMRAYRTMKDSWKQDDDGKPRGATQNGIEQLGSSAAQSALDITKEDVSKRLKDVITLMGMVEFARCFYQMVTHYTSNSPGFECETVYGEETKAIQKLLCEALDKNNGEYASPKDGSSTANNPYIRCTNAENSQLPCLPASVGDYLELPGLNGKYHAVKVDVFPALDGEGVIDLADVNAVSRAFNEVFSIHDTRLCDDTGEVGWFPHPKWMGKVATGNASVPMQWTPIPDTEGRAIIAPLYENVWVKKVQSTDATQHTAGTIVRNLLNMVETLTEFKRTAVATIVTATVAMTFPNFLSNMTSAIASATTLMEGLACLRLSTALSSLQSFFMNEHARNHEEMREQVVKVENLQNETAKEVEDVSKKRALELESLETLKSVQKALMEYTGLAEAGYNASGVSQRALTYPDVSGSQNVTFRFTGRTAFHVATCLLAFQEPVSSALQSSALQLSAPDSPNLLKNALFRTAHMNGYTASGTHAWLAGTINVCIEQQKKELYFTGPDAKVLAQRSQIWFPLEQGALIADKSPLEVAYRALGMQSIPESEEAVQLHDDNKLTIGNINAEFSNPEMRLVKINERLESLDFTKENQKERVKLLEQKQYYTMFLERLRFQLSNEPTYSMAIYDMINGLYLGSFTTALFEWSDESNEGRQVLMAVVRALQEATMNIKGAVLGVYDRTRSTEALDDLFSNNMRDSAEFKKVAKVLSKLTGMEEDEIANDEAFLSEIKDIFSDRFDTSGFSKFMELILKQKTRTVLDCQKSEDSICRQKLSAELSALQFRLQNKLPRSQPIPSETLP